MSVSCCVRLQPLCVRFLLYPIGTVSVSYCVRLEICPIVIVPVSYCIRSTLCPIATTVCLFPTVSDCHCVRFIQSIVSDSFCTQLGSIYIGRESPLFTLQSGQRGYWRTYLARVREMEVADREVLHEKIGDDLSLEIIVATIRLRSRISQRKCQRRGRETSAGLAALNAPLPDSRGLFLPIGIRTMIPRWERVGFISHMWICITEKKCSTVE